MEGCTEDGPASDLMQPVFAISLMFFVCTEARRLWSHSFFCKLSDRLCLPQASSLPLSITVIMSCLSPTRKFTFKLLSIYSRQLLLYGLILLSIRLIEAIEADPFSLLENHDLMGPLGMAIVAPHKTSSDQALKRSGEPPHVGVERPIRFDPEDLARQPETSQGMTTHDYSSEGRSVDEYHKAQLNTSQAMPARGLASTHPSDRKFSDADMLGSEKQLALDKGLRLANLEKLEKICVTMDQAPYDQFATLDEHVQIPSYQPRREIDPSADTMGKNYVSSAPLCSLPPKKRKAYLNDDQYKPSEASATKLSMRQVQPAENVKLHGLGGNNAPECVINQEPGEVSTQTRRKMRPRRPQASAGIHSDAHRTETRKLATEEKDLLQTEKSTVDQTLVFRTPAEYFRFRKRSCPSRPPNSQALRVSTFKTATDRLGDLQLKQLGLHAALFEMLDELEKKWLETEGVHKRKANKLEKLSKFVLSEISFVTKTAVYLMNIISNLYLPPIFKSQESLQEAQKDAFRMLKELWMTLEISPDRPNNIDNQAWEAERLMIDIKQTGSYKKVSLVWIATSLLIRCKMKVIYNSVMDRSLKWLCFPFKVLVSDIVIQEGRKINIGEIEEPDWERFISKKFKVVAPESDLNEIKNQLRINLFDPVFPKKQRTVKSRLSTIVGGGLIEKKGSLLSGSEFITEPLYHEKKNLNWKSIDPKDSADFSKEYLPINQKSNDRYAAEIQRKHFFTPSPSEQICIKEASSQKEFPEVNPLESHSYNICLEGNDAFGFGDSKEGFSLYKYWAFRKEFATWPKGTTENQRKACISSALITLGGIEVNELELQKSENQFLSLIESLLMQAYPEKISYPGEFSINKWRLEVIKFVTRATLFHIKAICNIFSPSLFSEDSLRTCQKIAYENLTCLINSSLFSHIQKQIKSVDNKKKWNKLNFEVFCDTCFTELPYFEGTNWVKKLALTWKTTAYWIREKYPSVFRLIGERDNFKKHFIILMDDKILELANTVDLGVPIDQVIDFKFTRPFKLRRPV